MMTGEDVFFPRGKCADGGGVVEEVGGAIPEAGGAFRTSGDIGGILAARRRSRDLLGSHLESMALVCLQGGGMAPRVWKADAISCNNHSLHA